MSWAQRFTLSIALVLASGALGSTAAAQHVGDCANYPLSCNRAPQRPPVLYPVAFTLVPGVLLVGSGVVTYALGSAEDRRANGPYADPSFDSRVPAGIALMSLGGALVLTSGILLAVRLRKRQRWERARAAVANLRLTPVCRVSARDQRSLGVQLSAVF